MINLSNPYDKPVGFDFYSDILRQTRPKESIKTYYKFLYEERRKFEKFKEYNKMLNQIENADLAIKNDLNERLQTYRDKLKKIQVQKKNMLQELMYNTNQTNIHRPYNKRARGTILDNDNRKILEEEKFTRTFQLLLEKKRTFLTALDDLENAPIILKPILRQHSSDVVLNRKIKAQASISQKCKKLAPTTSQKLKIEQNLPKITKNQNKPKIPPIELPFEYGEVFFPVLTKKNNSGNTG